MNKLGIEIKCLLYYQNCYGSFLMDGNMFNYCQETCLVLKWHCMIRLLMKVKDYSQHLRKPFTILHPKHLTEKQVTVP